MEVDSHFALEIEAHPPDDLAFVRLVAEAMASVNWVPLLPEPPRELQERIGQQVRAVYPAAWTGIVGGRKRVRIIARRDGLVSE